MTRGVGVWLECSTSRNSKHEYCATLRQRSLASLHPRGSHPVWCSDFEDLPEQLVVSSHRAGWLTSHGSHLSIFGTIATASLDGGKATSIAKSYEYDNSFDCGTPEESVECGRPGPTIAADATTLVYDLEGVLYRYNPAGPVKVFAAPVTDWPLSMSVAANRVVLVENGKIEVRSLGDGSLQYAIKEPKYTDVSAFATAKYLVVVRGAIELRDLATGNLVKTVRLPRNYGVTADANRIAYVTRAGEITIYDPATNKAKVVARDRLASHPILDGHNLAWYEDAIPPVVKAMSGV